MNTADRQRLQLMEVGEDKKDDTNLNNNLKKKIKINKISMGFLRWLWNNLLHFIQFWWNRTTFSKYCHLLKIILTIWYLLKYIIIEKLGIMSLNKYYVIIFYTDAGFIEIPSKLLLITQQKKRNSATKINFQGTSDR